MKLGAALFLSILFAAGWIGLRAGCYRTESMPLHVAAAPSAEGMESKMTAAAAAVLKHHRHRRLLMQVEVAFAAGSNAAKAGDDIEAGRRLNEAFVASQLLPGDGQGWALQDAMLRRASEWPQTPRIQRWLKVLREDFESRRKEARH